MNFIRKAKIVFLSSIFLVSCKMNSGSEVSNKRARPEFLGVVEKSGNSVNSTIMWLSLLKIDTKATGIDNVSACLYSKHLNGLDLNRMDPYEIEKSIEDASLITKKQVKFKELLNRMNLKLQEDSIMYRLLGTVAIPGGLFGATAATSKDINVIYDNSVGGYIIKVNGAFGAKTFNYTSRIAHIVNLRESIFEAAIFAWESKARIAMQDPTGLKQIADAPLTDDILEKIIKNPQLETIEALFDDGKTRVVKIDGVRKALGPVKNGRFVNPEVYTYLSELEAFHKDVNEVKFAIKAIGIPPNQLDELIEGERLIETIAKRQKITNAKLVAAGVMIVGAGALALRLASPTQVAQKDFIQGFSKKLTLNDLEKIENAGLEMAQAGNLGACPSAENAWKNIVRYRYGGKL